MSDINRARKQKLAKVAIAKSNRVVVDIGGIAGDTVNKLNNLSSSLGVSYNSSNIVINNDTVERLEANTLHGVISGMSVSINPNPRYFDISSGVFYINGVRVEYSGDTIDTVSIGGGSFASVTMNNSGQVSILPNTFPTSAQLESQLELTAFTKLDSNTIGNIGDSFFVSLNFIKKIFIRNKLFVGTLFAQSAGFISRSIIPLQLDMDGGEINTPNSEVKEIVSTNSLSANLMYHINGIYSILPTALLNVDVVNYDDGTSLVPIPNNKFIVHTISRSSRTESIYFTYAKVVYNKLTEALFASYDLGPFASTVNSEVEPLALIVVDQGSASIVEVIDIRGGNSKLSSASSTQDLGWKDNIIPFGLAGKANQAPTEVTDSIGWRRLSFDEGDGVYVDFHVNHDYARGTDAYPHIHWMPTSTMTAGQTVIWEFSYIIARGHQQGDSLLATPTSMSIVHTSDGTEIAGEHMVTECRDIDAFDLIEPDTVISCKVERGNGTYNSAVYGIMSDLHYQADRDSTINKSPDFYR